MSICILFIRKNYSIIIRNIIFNQAPVYFDMLAYSINNKASDKTAHLHLWETMTKVLWDSHADSSVAKTYIYYIILWFIKFKRKIFIRISTQGVRNYGYHSQYNWYIPRKWMNGKTKHFVILMEWHVYSCHSIFVLFNLSKLI